MQKLRHIEKPVAFCTYICQNEDEEEKVENKWIKKAPKHNDQKLARANLSSDIFWASAPLLFILARALVYAERSWPQKFKSWLLVAVVVIVARNQPRLLQMGFPFSARFHSFAWFSMCVYVLVVWTWLQLVYILLFLQLLFFFYCVLCYFFVFTVAATSSYSSFSSCCVLHLFVHSFIHLYIFVYYTMNFHSIIKLGLMIHMIHI